jgi:hypothetical protein
LHKIGPLSTSSGILSLLDWWYEWVEDTVCASFGELLGVVRDIGMSVLPDFQRRPPQAKRKHGGRGLLRMFKDEGKSKSRTDFQGSYSTLLI